MTQEEKELLLKDLCSRLPYDVNVLDDMGRTYKLQLGNSYLIDLFYGNGDYVEAPIRPYLRPISSMTEEEKKEFTKVLVKSQDCSYENNESSTTIVNDWYLSKGFDVRGLIPKGLSLEAKEDMYK